MKKTLFLAVLAGAALAGCVKNEEAVKSDTSPERIKFEAPVVGVPVRATEIVGPSFPTDQNFAVYALYHEGTYDENSFTNGSIYMTNVTCTHTGTETGDDPNEYWAPANNYYWPKNDNAYLTFAAYSPAKNDASSAEGGVWNGAQVAWGATGFTFQNFKVNDDPTKQIDLLYSERQYSKQNNSTDVVTDNPYDGVTIPFKHALSSIVFKAKTEGTISGSTIRITGIEVKNVVNTGTFAQNLTANVTGDADDTKPAWTVIPGTDGDDDDTRPDNIKDYTVLESNFATDNTSGKVLSDTAAEVIDGATLSGGKQRSDLILIPQTLDESGRTVSVIVKYSIQNGSEEPVESSKEFNLAVKDQNGDGTLEFVWEMGKRYTYTITIGLDKIYFNPTVTNYDDVEGGATAI